MPANNDQLTAIRYELGIFTDDQARLPDAVVNYFWDSQVVPSVLQTAISVAESKAASAADDFPFSVDGQSFTPNAPVDSWSSVAARLRHKLLVQTSSGMLVTKAQIRAQRRIDAGAT